MNSPQIEKQAGSLAERLLPPLNKEELLALKQLDSVKRVAVAQIKSDPGEIDQNTQRIVESIRSAKAKGADLLVGVECGVPGYLSMDRFYDQSYLERNVLALKEILPETDGITAIVGFVDQKINGRISGSRPEIYNSAAIIRDQQILAYIDKSLLPTYGIFDEDRYFTSGRRNPVIQIGETRIGTTICEDIWSEQENYLDSPVSKLKEDSADLVVNLSASPFHLGKQQERTALISRVAREHQLKVIYANLVGSYDGYDGEVVFDGRSLIADEKGKILSEGKAFKEDLLVVDLDQEQPDVITNLPEVEELYQALVLGIQDYLRRLRPDNQRVVIGLSGGIDSAVVAALAVDALGPENVIAATLPSKYNSSQTYKAALELADNLNIPIKEIPIQGAVDAALNDLLKDQDLAENSGGVADENVQARMRMIYLMYLGNALDAIVLNTGNKTELALNNCTIYGDMVGGFSVLGDVDKDRVYSLARHINIRAGQEIIPEFSIVSVPTAELKTDQFDQDVMGDDPRRLAPFVRDIIENNLSLNDTVERWSNQYSAEFILKAHQKIANAEWKRRQASPGIRVTPRAFGIGRRMPMGTQFSAEEISKSLTEIQEENSNE